MLDILEKQEKEAQGDGRAVFLSDMTEDEYAEYKHMEVDGWRKFYRKIFHG